MTPIYRYSLIAPDRSAVAIGSTPGRVRLTREAPESLSFCSAAEASDWAAGVADPRAPGLAVEAVPAGVGEVR